MLADIQRWRIIERGGEPRATELREYVPMILMADSESAGLYAVNIRMKFI